MQLGKRRGGLIEPTSLKESFLRILNGERYGILLILPNGDVKTIKGNKDIIKYVPYGLFLIDQNWNPTFQQIMIIFQVCVTWAIRF